MKLHMENEVSRKYKQNRKIDAKKRIETNKWHLPHKINYMISFEWKNMKNRTLSSLKEPKVLFHFFILFCLHFI